MYIYIYINSAKYDARICFIKFFECLLNTVHLKFRIFYVFVYIYSAYSYIAILLSNHYIYRMLLKIQHLHPSIGHGSDKEVSNDV